jgi:hypothetical protein
MFGSKIYCNEKGTKVKKNTAETCHSFTAGSAPSNVNPIEHSKSVLFRDYKATCNHCSFNRDFTSNLIDLTIL